MSGKPTLQNPSLQTSSLIEFKPKKIFVLYLYNQFNKSWENLNLPFSYK